MPMRKQKTKIKRKLQGTREERAAFLKEAGMMCKYIADPDAFLKEHPDYFTITVIEPKDVTT